MLALLKRLIFYSILRLGVSVSSLFSSKREAMISFAIIALVAGAFFMFQDSKNKQLLEQAGTGDAETITQTVQSGATLAATDDFGRSALHIAARYSNLETVGALLLMGAEVNALDFKQRTPLHMTRYDGGANTEILRLLLEHGADPEAKDYKGRTPLDILRAQNRYNKPAEALLKDAIKRKHAAEKRVLKETLKVAAELARQQKGQASPPAPSSDTPWKTHSEISR